MKILKIYQSREIEMVRTCCTNVNEHVPKKILKAQMYGIRKRGRSRRKRTGNLEKNVKAMGRENGGRKLWTEER